MNYRTIKKSQKRMETPYSPSWKITQYGTDNIYPQVMSDLIDNSPTGGTCLERYRTFLEGNGLMSDEFSKYICNRQGDTVDDLYRLIAADVAKYHGFALHLNYNLNCEITEAQHIPFETCRMNEPDDTGRVPFISVHPDWEGKKTRNGKTVAINNKTIRKFYPYNPRKDVVLSQIEADGGIETFRGQILWVSFDGRWVYPKTVYDKVATELSIDEGLSNVKYRSVRNNFLLAGMIVHKAGATIGVDDEGNEIITEAEDTDFQESLEVFQGDTNACSIMEVTVQQDEDIPKFVSMEGVNFDKKFDSTERSTTERIYAAFNQEPWYIIRIGKTGFSGEVLKQAYEYYNSYVAAEQRTISRHLENIFTHWYEKACPEEDYSIQPLVYLYNYITGDLNEIQRQNGANEASNNTDRD